MEIIFIFLFFYCLYKFLFDEEPQANPLGPVDSPGPSPILIILAIVGIVALVIGVSWGVTMNMTSCVVGDVVDTFRGIY